MSNYTTEYWEVDGVSLSRYAWGIETVGGSRWGLPPMRGDNATYAYLPGQSFRQKIPDSRTMLLQMFVIGINPSTDAYVSNPRVQWNDNWRTLQKLFFTPTRQITLTRRWETSTGMQTASAQAQVVGTLDPEMTGRSRATFEVELLLADPFFYGPVITKNLTVNTPLTFTYNGDYSTMTARDMVATITGQIANPRITNSATTPPNWFQVATDVAISDSVTVDIGKVTAVRTSDSQSVLGGVTHSGSRRLLLLQPGTNTLTLTGTSGAGTATLTYRECFV